MPSPSPHTAHHFNAHTRGGAAIAAIRIARALRDTGCRISFWHKEDEPTAPLGDMDAGSPYYAKPNRWLYGWKKQAYRRASAKKTEHLYLPYFYDRPVFTPGIYGDGVLHLHALGGDFFDFETFFGSIPDSHPIVWTIHDRNPLTGGCSITGACRGFLKQCGNCPKLSPAKEYDITRRAMEIKLRVLKGKNLHLVAPSHGMADCVRESAVGKMARSIRTIHNPLDTDFFSPVSRESARQAIGITSSAPVLLFGATNTQIAHKGIQHLIPAVLRLRHKVAFQIVTFGHSVPPELLGSGIAHTHLGFVNDPSFLRMMYNAADVLAMPSLEESLGQVGTEALACGTPIVAFKTGGIPDYVRPLETGFLAETGNTDELTQRLEEALSDLPRLQSMREDARKLAVELFETGQQSQKYLNLYGEICT